VRSMPRDRLAKMGWETDILVVDNGSTDDTGEIALRAGARVVVQPVRGYGNAYKAGFANTTGSIVATGDADLTYPFEELPRLVKMLLDDDIDFLTTDRLHRSNRTAMKPSHRFGNMLLTRTSRALFGFPFNDSQSGMWLFRRHILRTLDLRSPGMAFSQEIKHEAIMRGFRCAEIPITYRARGGEVKLNATRDGLRNLGQLAVHRARNVNVEVRPVVIDLNSATPALRVIGDAPVLEGGPALETA
jgi:glycosyltransferase involved in cell wall biosynthesis